MNFFLCMEFYITLLIYYFFLFLYNICNTKSPWLNRYYIYVTEYIYKQLHKWQILAWMVKCNEKKIREFGYCCRDARSSCVPRFVPGRLLGNHFNVPVVPKAWSHILRCTYLADIIAVFYCTSCIPRRCLVYPNLLYICTRYNSRVLL